MLRKKDIKFAWYVIGQVVLSGRPFRPGMTSRNGDVSRSHGQCCATARTVTTAATTTASTTTTASATVACRVFYGHYPPPPPRHTAG